MALSPVTLTIKPNVDTISTAFQSMGQISESNLIRYLNKQIQKLGGCRRLVDTPFPGIATAIMPWGALNGTKYIAIGTSAVLDVYSLGGIANITPAAGPGSGDWSLDKWGQDLVASPAGRTVYHWIPPVAGGNIATPVPNAPPVINGLIVAAPQQQIITWGAFSTTLGTQDPMLVKWCDVSGISVWTAAVDNQAGSFRIPHGSEIMAVMWPGLSGILWTDLDVWAITYVNYPLVYGFNNISQNGGLIGRRAVAQLGQRIAWMSQNTFFIFQGGAIQELDCSVVDFVFDNLDKNFLDAIHADANAYYGEIMWRFPVHGSGGVCTAYVKIQWDGGETYWDYGYVGPNISAWSDQSIVGAPMGTDYNGLIQQFENDIDWDDNPYNSGFLSGWFYLQEGHVSTFLERIRPDFSINPGGEIMLSVIFADEIPEDDTDYPIRIYGPYPVTRATPFIIVRGSGMVARIKLECTKPGTFWRYGKPMANIAPDGSR